jgi:hypothetical protein
MTIKEEEKKNERFSQSEIFYDFAAPLFCSIIHGDVNHEDFHHIFLC